VTWLPIQGTQREFLDVPEEIAGAAVEAWTCFAAGSARGAVALARAVVEATAKAKGITTGTLNAKIDALAAATLIRPGVRDQAHTIRSLGNDVAHGDLGVALLREEAEEVLELMGEVLNEVFQSPARSARLTAAREARQNAAAAARDAS